MTKTGSGAKRRNHKVEFPTLWFHRGGLGASDVKFPFSSEHFFKFTSTCQWAKALDGINKSHLHAQCVRTASCRKRLRERRPWTVQIIRLALGPSELKAQLDGEIVSPLLVFCSMLWKAGCQPYGLHWRALHQQAALAERPPTLFSRVAFIYSIQGRMVGHSAECLVLGYSQIHRSYQNGWSFSISRFTSHTRMLGPSVFPDSRILRMLGPLMPKV